MVKGNGAVPSGAVSPGWPGHRPGIVAGVVRGARRPGVWPAVAVVTVTLAGLLLAGCGAGVTTSEQRRRFPGR
jgi:hypothetical protein